MKAQKSGRAAVSHSRPVVPIAFNAIIPEAVTNRRTMSNPMMHRQPRILQEPLHLNQPEGRTESEPPALKAKFQSVTKSMALA
jgi:hypothetical protein